MIKKILILLLIAFIAIQFFHPARNQAAGPQPHSIATVAPIPANVQSVLAKACNDCHTNNTNYPWYSKIQPVDWWLSDHVKDGKKHLNFDEYTSRSLRYQYHKLEEVVEQVETGEMPLESYTWIHKEAKLTADEKTLLINWANERMEAMKAKYPIDSLIRKKS
jgi:hypothetical protein